MTCLLGMCVCTVFSTSVFLNFGCVFEFGSTLFLAQLWFAVLVVVVVVLFWLNFVLMFMLCCRQVLLLSCIGSIVFFDMNFVLSTCFF